MSRFVLIEQSLCKVGGHFFEYSMEVLRAAEEAGYEPVLAINQAFPDLDLIPDHWTVFRCFPYSSGRIHRIPSRSATDLTVQSKSRTLTGFADQLISLAADRFKTAISDRRYIRRWKRIHSFANACSQIFDEVNLEDGDQVLCSTMADLDLLGLVRFLRRTPQSRKADWHLQFHFSIYHGRDPDYHAQKRKINKLISRFRDALASIPEHRVHFYTTTEHLTRQFNSLQVADFQTMNWAVGRRFCGGPSRSGSAKLGFVETVASEGRSNRAISGTVLDSQRAKRNSPLKLYCPGGIRREKGADQIRWLMKELREDLLNTGQVQLFFQTDERRRAQAILDIPRQDVIRHSSELTDVDPTASVVSLPFPLAAEPYARAIRGADIGLLMYQSDDYYARCSGILLELLTAGVPVIVPAGCWLSDQIEAANAEYLRQLAAAQTLVSWTQRDIEIEGSPLILKPRLTVEDEVGNILVRLDWRQWVPGGTFVRTELLQLDERGDTLVRENRIHACDLPDRQTWAGFKVHPQARSYRLSLSNPYGDHPLPTANVEMNWLRAGSRPIGKVGLAFSDPRQLPGLIREMVEHYDHFRVGAQEFAQTVIEAHDPAQTIRTLVGRAA